MLYYMKVQLLLKLIILNKMSALLTSLGLNASLANAFIFKVAVE